MSRISDLAGFTTALSTTQDLSVGVITATSFSGDGSGLTGVASTDNIQTATDAKFLANVNITGITTATGGFVGALTGNATGLSGTPNITVGSVTAASGTFSGNVTIGGTLTYQDVEHIDSVGIITAQQGIQVLANGLTITGVSTFNDNIDLQDNDKILLGTGDDIEIFHNGTYGAITNSDGSFFIGGSRVKVTNAAISEVYVDCLENGRVDLFHDNSVKLTTDTGGVKITGIATATGFKVGTAISVSDGAVSATRFHGDGSSLTGISVGITTESITATDRTIATLNLSKDSHKVNVSGVATIDCQGGSEYGTHILTIVNTGIATVGFSTYFLFPSGSEPSLPTASGTISQLSFTVHRVGAAGTQVLTTAALNFS